MENGTNQKRSQTDNVNVAIIIFSAFAYRIGGSEWTGHDSTLRGLRLAKLALRALPLALAVLLLGCPVWLCVLAWLLTGAADSLPHGQWQGASNAAQVAMISLVTVVTTAPCAAALLYIGDIRHAIAALIAGVLGGSVTWVGNKIPFHFRVGPIGFNQGPEIGEFMRGLTRVTFIMV